MPELSSDRLKELVTKYAYPPDEDAPTAEIAFLDAFRAAFRKWCWHRQGCTYAVDSRSAAEVRSFRKPPDPEKPITIRPCDCGYKAARYEVESATEVGARMYVDQREWPRDLYLGSGGYPDNWCRRHERREMLVILSAAFGLGGVFGAGVISLSFLISRLESWWFIVYPVGPLVLLGGAFFIGLLAALWRKAF